MTSVLAIKRNWIFPLLNRKIIKVTFFNDFGDSFLKAIDNQHEQPLIISICCGKVSDWKCNNFNHIVVSEYYF